MNHNYSFDTVENMESEIKVEDIDFGFSRSNSLRLDKIVSFIPFGLISFVNF